MFIVSQDFRLQPAIIMHDTNKLNLVEALAEAEVNPVDWPAPSAAEETHESDSPTTPPPPPPPPQPTTSATTSATTQTQDKPLPSTNTSDNKATNTEEPSGTDKKKRKRKAKKTLNDLIVPEPNSTASKRKISKKLDMNSILANSLQLCDAIDIHPINNEAIASIVVKSCQDRVLKLLSDHAMQSKRPTPRKSRTADVKIETE